MHTPLGPPRSTLQPGTQREVSEASSGANTPLFRVLPPIVPTKPSHLTVTVSAELNLPISQMRKRGAQEARRGPDCSSHSYNSISKCDTSDVFFFKSFYFILEYSRLTML